jgi:hypothetical protein
MHLLSLLIAPLQAVVLFFAPHASAPRLPRATGTQPPPASLPTRPSALRPVRALRDAPAGPAGRPADATPGALPSRHPLPASQPCSPQSAPRIAVQSVHRVRVVRNVDSSLPADRAGRMTVSGRFADVCAELDRLIALNMRPA